MMIEGERSQGAHLRVLVRNESGINRVDNLVYLVSIRHVKGVRLTVRIPRLPAFSSPCIPRTEGTIVRRFGCDIS